MNADIITVIAWYMQKHDIGRPTALQSLCLCTNQSKGSEIYTDENMACGSGRACCRCNKKGYCHNCCCVKSGHFCTSCLPSKLGNCANLPAKQSPSPVPYPTYSASRALSPSPVPAQPSAVSPHHTSPAFSLSSHNSVVDLPSFKTMSDPNFVWGVLSGNECISVINRWY